MKHIASQPSNPVIVAIHQLGIRNQQLLTRSLDLKRLEIARELKTVDAELCALLNIKELGGSTRYIWRTQGDDKVRSAHAANSGKIFLWDAPLATGHPGEGFNCRCWAEPVGAEEYARQTLISSVNDSADRWTDQDLNDHYRNGSGISVTLSKMGYLGDVIEHYGNTLGVYKRVNSQIIAKAKQQGVGSLLYDFSNSYTFGGLFPAVLYSLGESTVSGVFIGDTRVVNNYLVITGYIHYEFYDEFADRFQTVETIDRIPTVNREEAEQIAEDLFEVGDSDGRVFEITDKWKTKFNATVQLKSQ